MEREILFRGIDLPMEAYYHGKGIYIGDEFPKYYGLEIDIWDDNTNANAPCYKIRFSGSNEIIGNMDDSDLEF